MNITEFSAAEFFHRFADLLAEQEELLKVTDPKSAKLTYLIQAGIEYSRRYANVDVLARMTSRQRLHGPREN